LIDELLALKEGWLGEGKKNERETCFHTFVPATNTEQAILGFKTGPCSVKLLSNHVKYGMAVVHVS
jgi:hypothetical protein